MRDTLPRAEVLRKLARLPVDCGTLFRSWLVERLGVGGMAETFLAVRRGPGDFEQRLLGNDNEPDAKRESFSLRAIYDAARERSAP